MGTGSTCVNRFLLILSCLIISTNHCSSYFQEMALKMYPLPIYIFSFSAWLRLQQYGGHSCNLITSSESILLLTQMNNIGQRFPSEIRIKEVHLHPSLEFARAPGRSKPKRVSCPAEGPSLSRREPHTAVKTPVAHPETRLPRLWSWEVRE